MTTDLAGKAQQAEAVKASAAHSRVVMLALFGFTVFCSAFLLFQVQLVIAKYILPWFGGTPAVFTTCILFFQILLLLGYAYAYLTNGWLRPRAQAGVHSLLIVLALAVLVFRLSTWGSPLLPASSWKPSGSEHPLLRIVTLLVASVAFPYFLVSTTGPLLQAWYGRISSEVPYRLYALSNAGSLIALITYPVIVEPLLSLKVQALVWGIGFLLFGAGCIATAWCAAREDQTGPREFQCLDEPQPSIAPNWRRKVVWLLLAAIGSLSLLATTNRICQDVAVVPLLWVLPLSLYLLSFVVCFSSERWYSRTLWSAGLGLATLLVSFALYQPRLGVIWQIGIYSFALFASCMVCHGELVQLKPPKDYLTSFYLFVAAGGALGGLFVSIIAPIIFKGFWEFHLSVWLCCLLFCLILLRDTQSWIYQPKPLLLAFSALVVFAGPGLAAIGWRPVALLICFLVVAALFALTVFGTSSGKGSVGQQRRAAVFSVCFTTLLLAAVLAYPPVVIGYGAIRMVRNFYGVLTVTSDKVGGFPVLTLRHGRISHGFQFCEETKKRTPTSYFTPQSGIGLVLTSYPGRAAGRTLRIGVVGLGVGTIAAYGIPGDYMRFYEINPDVVRIANSGPQGMFTFLSDSRAEVEVIPGDARISLEQELKQNKIQDFDVLVIDAFSGDAIPVHLLTEEAFQLYLRHLSKPNGILAFHISNDALDLRPVIARLAAESDMSAWMASSNPGIPGNPSVWVIVAALNRDGPVPGVEHMRKITPSPHFPLWTDDYSNLVRVLRW
ncbi:MAG: fused MFS/spermidine synthase [Candidatus Korobacteraceae bacterium]